MDQGIEQDVEECKIRKQNKKSNQINEIENRIGYRLEK